MIYGKAEDIADKYISGYKEEKERKKAEKARGRPPTWDETVSKRVCGWLLWLWVCL